MGTQGRTGHVQQAGMISEQSLRGEASAWFPQLSALLEEQSILCEGLEALSVRQSRAVGEGDTEGLLKILGQREVLVDRVTEINRLLGPFRENRDGAMARLAAAQRDGVMQKVGRIAALVESVRARDDADRAALEKMQASVADELASLSRARTAAGAYGRTGIGAQAQAAYGGPKFQDRSA